MSDKPHIVLGVSGSIAAFKAAELVRQFAARGWDTSVIMTAAATRYVGVLTFEALTGHPVAVGGFEEFKESSFQHIALARRARVIVIAPCTANVMAKIACGLADDVLTSTVLARDVPLVIAPAMNTCMWNNPATQANKATLEERGITVLEVGRGELACGETGDGRLCELALIVEAVARQIET